MTNGVLGQILRKRGITDTEAFLHPNYDATRHDPFLLPDMDEAVERILAARDNNEKVVIYGDYDVDGMCATAILVDALGKFGLNVETYTPNRFTEGYGLNMDALRGLAKTDATLVITVDCGSLSHEEIEVANKLKLDMIVTDHHAVGETMPPAVAVINPHREDSEYPLKDLAGCGVAFKLVQALQLRCKQEDVSRKLSQKTQLDSRAEPENDNLLPLGQEKWLLDLVALGTICDIVPLTNENRNNVYWGIEVLKKTRRPGLKALMAVTKIAPSTLNARTIGFVLGPRLNAAGRITTAKSALELLTTTDNKRALELAQNLDSLNSARRQEQDKIFAEACEILDCHPELVSGSRKSNSRMDSPAKPANDEPVIIVAKEGWNEGVIGIVANKLMEKYGKPTFVLSIGKDEIKGSGRSFGNFDLSAAIDATRKYLIKGGGHAAAGGVTLAPENLAKWRDNMYKTYISLHLLNQEKFLSPNEDLTTTDLTILNTNFVHDLDQLEPFGLGNEKPIFHLSRMHVKFVDRIGTKKNHLKLTISDGQNSLKFLAFDPPTEWFVEPGSKIDLWVNLEINEWQGTETVEGRILRLE